MYIESKYMSIFIKFSIINNTSTKALYYLVLLDKLDFLLQRVAPNNLICFLLLFCFVFFFFFQSLWDPCLLLFL